jgi:hypothetical protein
MCDTNVSDEKCKHCGWSDKLVKLTPLLSVLIAMCTVVFSVYQYYNQRQAAWEHEQLDQAIKVRSQIRSDLDQITQFPSNKSSTLSGVEFLLGDLDELVQGKSSSATDASSSVQKDRRRISKILHHLVADDSNYDRLRDVDFSIVVFDSWEDYRNYLKEDPELIWDVLLHYNDALAALRVQAPEFISQIEFDKNQSEYWYPSAKPEVESHIRHFEDLLIGFNKHLKLLDQNSELRRMLIKHFQVSTCNEKLTKDQFGLSFDPKGDKDLFRNCL